jgi:hypothetical protein
MIPLRNGMSPNFTIYGNGMGKPFITKKILFIYNSKREVLRKHGHCLAPCAIMYPLPMDVWPFTIEEEVWKFGVKKKFFVGRNAINVVTFSEKKRETLGIVYFQ